MDLEGIMFSEISQRKTNTTCFHLCVESKKTKQDFPGGTVVKNPPANAGDTGSTPSPGRSDMLQSN